MLSIYICLPTDITVSLEIFFSLMVIHIASHNMKSNLVNLTHSINRHSSPCKTRNPSPVHCTMYVMYQDIGRVICYNCPIVQ